MLRSCRHLFRRYGYFRSARLCLPNQHDPNANQNDADPPPWRNAFMQENHSEKCEQCITERTRGHDVAVIRPAQHGHVANHESEQKENAKPNDGVCHRKTKCMSEASASEFHGTNIRHAALQQQVTGIGAHNHRQDHDQRLNPKPALASHFLILD